MTQELKVFLFDTFCFLNKNGYYMHFDKDMQVYVNLQLNTSADFNYKAKDEVDAFRIVLKGLIPYTRKPKYYTPAGTHIEVTRKILDRIYYNVFGVESYVEIKDIVVVETDFTNELSSRLVELERLSSIKK